MSFYTSENDEERRRPERQQFFRRESATGRLISEASLAMDSQKGWLVTELPDGRVAVVDGNRLRVGPFADDADADWVSRPIRLATDGTPADDEFTTTLAACRLVDDGQTLRLVYNAAGEQRSGPDDEFGQPGVVDYSLPDLVRTDTVELETGSYFGYSLVSPSGQTAIAHVPSATAAPIVMQRQVGGQLTTQTVPGLEPVLVDLSTGPTMVIDRVFPASVLGPYETLADDRTFLKVDNSRPFSPSGKPRPRSPVEIVRLDGTGGQTWTLPAAINDAESLVISVQSSPTLITAAAESNLFSMPKFSLSKRKTCLLRLDDRQLNAPDPIAWSGWIEETNMAIFSFQTEPIRWDLMTRIVSPDGRWMREQSRTSGQARMIDLSRLPPPPE